MAGSHHISRRDFIKLTTVAAGTAIVAAVGLPAVDFLIDPAVKAAKTDTWVPLGKLETFLVGTPTLVSFTQTTANGWEKTVNSYGVFVVRQSETDILVLSNKCTHLGCHVNWNTDKKEYICPCHDAQFSITGMVLGGPPPRPLDRYTGNQIKVEDDTLYIHFVEG